VELGSCQDIYSPCDHEFELMQVLLAPHSTHGCERTVATSDTKTWPA